MDLPSEKGIQYSGRMTTPSSLMNLSGRNCSGSGHSLSSFNTDNRLACTYKLWHEFWWILRDAKLFSILRLVHEFVKVRCIVWILTHLPLSRFKHYLSQPGFWLTEYICSKGTVTKGHSATGNFSYISTKIYSPARLAADPDLWIQYKCMESNIESCQASDISSSWMV